MIVNTAAVASKILEMPRRDRVTFLPLDKMTSRPITTADLKAAEKLVGKGNVFRAIDLVDFDQDLLPAMNHILGGVLVCSNLDVANKVAFDRSVGKVCVTLDGDKVNPSGELSGGKLKALFKIH